MDGQAFMYTGETRIETGNRVWFFGGNGNDELTTGKMYKSINRTNERRASMTEGDH